jgi:hypothetical protein
MWGTKYCHQGCLAQPIPVCIFCKGKNSRTKNNLHSRSVVISRRISTFWDERKVPLLGWTLSRTLSTAPGNKNKHQQFGTEKDRFWGNLKVMHHSSPFQQPRSALRAPSSRDVFPASYPGCSVHEVLNMATSTTSNARWPLSLCKAATVEAALQLHCCRRTFPPRKCVGLDPNLAAASLHLPQHEKGPTRQCLNRLDCL